MHIGLVTDSLAHLGLDDLLATAQGLGITRLEFGCGNWSSAPHLHLDDMLADAALRDEFVAKLAAHGIAISALNCSGNPMHPGELGQRQRDVTTATIRLAGLLGVPRVVMMSGCPGGPGDANANWITTAWPPEVTAVLDWQWEERLIPYWQELAAFAESNGVPRLCLELHGQQSVYNVRSLQRLRSAAGPVIGANFDPSHLFWMGADPLAAIPALGDAIYHVHAKDTLIHRANAAINGLIDVVPTGDVANRAWSYVTLGDGHDALWWGRFIEALRAAGYDDVLSIEHEDLSRTPLKGVERSINLLRQALNGN